MSQMELTAGDTVIATDDLESRSRGPLLVRSFGMTDRGRLRTQNEDQFLIAELRKALHVTHTSIPQPGIRHGNETSHVFVVADGMGGHAAGEEASMLAIETVEQFLLEAFLWFQDCSAEDQDTVLADFQKALGRANAQILLEARRRPELRGMGTTLTLAYFQNDELYLAHAGDSRCYLSRDGKLFRLTRDHTLVEELVRAGQLTPKQAARHPWRHNVTNAVGGVRPEIEVEVHKLHLSAGDRVMLCSDGLTEMVVESSIEQILAMHLGPEPTCRQLIEAANAAGGRDNITVICADFEE